MRESRNTPALFSSWLSCSLSAGSLAGSHTGSRCYAFEPGVLEFEVDAGMNVPSILILHDELARVEITPGSVAGIAEFRRFRPPRNAELRVITAN